MGRIIAVLAVIFLVAVQSGSAQYNLRVCATSRSDSDCDQLQRGTSSVVCQWVQDSIECAQRIRNGTADFGVFTAESTLMLASLGWDGLTVVKELRHIERAQASFDYASVAIVRADHTGGLAGLRGLNFCHPGYFYSRSFRWTERFLKQFERTVASTTCTEGQSPAEIEVNAMNTFFNSSCRPGSWSNNVEEDAILKSRYPSLCQLCGGTNQCEYPEGTNAHQQALNCLVTGGGNVTYVALQEAQNFFISNSALATSYGFLCPNGTVEPITITGIPCVWMRQPWPVVVASNNKAIELSSSLPNWLRMSGGWESALTNIILADSYQLTTTSIQLIRDYIPPFRSIPISAPLCDTQITWCTTSYEEQQKCDVIRAGGITIGIQPMIECSNPATSVVACMNDIANLRADFMGIDSNFGWMARQLYNLTAAAYAETPQEKYSSVVVVVKEGASFGRFENLRTTKACFPEFGGIASIAFVNTGKSRGFLTKSQCNYGTLLGEFFQETCSPGARNSLHDPFSLNPENLCTLCRPNAVAASSVGAAKIAEETPEDAPTEDDSEIAPAVGFDEESEVPLEEPVVEINNEQDDFNRAAADDINCVADSVTNRFYGNKGALQCLSELGDVAVLELQNLNAYTTELGLSPNNFRVMCRNGSLAAYTGFAVDAACALTTIVDGEIVVRRIKGKDSGIANALTSFDRYFQLDPDFKLYNIFGSQKNLLFKDSTIGVATPGEANLGPAVQNYIKLFENLEQCAGADSATANIVSSLVAVVTAVVFLRFFQ